MQLCFARYGFAAVISPPLEGQGNKKTSAGVWTDRGDFVYFFTLLVKAKLFLFFGGHADSDVGNKKKHDSYK
jgi:hypothetical protein